MIFNMNKKALTTLTSILLVTVPSANAFSILPNSRLSTTIPSSNSILSFTPVSSSTSSTTILKSTSSPTITTNQRITLELTKPLGLILEEKDNGGVIVTDVSDSGSAFQSQYAKDIIGLTIQQVMNENVSTYTLEQVMDLIVNGPNPITISFDIPSTSTAVAADNDNDDSSASSKAYEIGTKVTLKVLQDNKPDMEIETKVGLNLRKVLLENNVELYKGLKKKLGNCGGGGQCTFCTVEMVEEEDGWIVGRSEYEEKKIGKQLNGKGRMACLNNIQGPATIRIPN